MVETGTKTELANTSGKITTKPADCAASAPRTVSATNAKIQLSASPKAATSATQASASAGRQEAEADHVADERHQADDQDVANEVRERAATRTAERAIGIERKRSITPRSRSWDSPTAVCVARKVTDCTKIPAAGSPRS